ncbi:hypothetical protein MLD38_026704 [Melastoma candidum]|uniref:Uncharacterized protein n=1 Tax=Melastoma candidum TaxID=119954 RepID=A0ACB9NZG1_9MYRT|nr:hypothetical protein MLD38_026704 [Melastoma candidum]
MLKSWSLPRSTPPPTSPSDSVYPHLPLPHHHSFPDTTTTNSLPSLRFRILLPPAAAARRASSYPPEGGGNGDLVEDARNWGRAINSMYGEGGGDEDEESDDEEEEDRSLDLLIRFVQNVFKKVSKRARKAVRSVLPSSISTKLVGFSVNGALILTFLWVLKAFLEVVCTLGSAVFISILVIRGVWSGVAYFQETQSNPQMNEMDNDRSAWTGVRPAT